MKVAWSCIPILPSYASILVKRYYDPRWQVCIVLQIRFCLNQGFLRFSSMSAKIVRRIFKMLSN